MRLRGLVHATGIDLSTVRFAEPSTCGCWSRRRCCWSCWVWQLARAAARRAAVPPASAAAGPRAVSDLRRPAVLALPDPRERLHDPGARAADRRRLAGPHGRRRSRHPAGRLGVDAHADVAGNRWQRSMRFLRHARRVAGWRDDRIAMALFAHIAAPQVRLTKDPEHVLLLPRSPRTQESPFRLEDDTTWDTNIELGIAWGMRLIEKDEELYGKSPNAKAFVLISDGQAWSGEVARSLQMLAAATGSPSTSSASARRPAASFRSRAQAERHRCAASNRRFAPRSIATSLAQIANAGGGEYLRARSRGRPRNLEPDHRRGPPARRIARAAGRDRRALLALPGGSRRVPGRRPPVPAGADRAAAAGRWRRRRARARLDAYALTRVVIRDLRNPASQTILTSRRREHPRATIRLLQRSQPCR